MTMVLGLTQVSRFFMELWYQKTVTNGAFKIIRYIDCIAYSCSSLKVKNIWNGIIAARNVMIDADWNCERLSCYATVTSSPIQIRRQPRGYRSHTDAGGDGEPGKYRLRGYGRLTVMVAEWSRLCALGNFALYYCISIDHDITRNAWNANSSCLSYDHQVL